MLETGINIIEWPSLQYCTMSAFRGYALQRKAMSHKSSFIIIDYESVYWSTWLEGNIPLFRIFILMGIARNHDKSWANNGKMSKVKKLCISATEREGPHILQPETLNPGYWWNIQRNVLTIIVWPIYLIHTCIWRVLWQNTICAKFEKCELPLLIQSGLKIELGNNIFFKQNVLYPSLISGISQ